eukprot:Gb_36108 [translate_table: standard]
MNGHGIEEVTRAEYEKLADKNNKADWLIHVKDIFAHEVSECIRPASEICIYKLPTFLLDIKGEAYVPRVVSLGPSYHNQRRLSGMEYHKREAVRRMLARLQGKFTIDSVIEEIQKLEKEIRASYEEVIDCDAETLAWMFTLDASFLLEILRSYCEEMPRPANYGEDFEPVFDRYKIEHNGIHILHDILKLENQIPLAVLRKLLELEVGSIEEANEMLYAMLFYGGPLRRFYPFTRGCLLFYGGQLLGGRHVLDCLTGVVSLSLSYQSDSMDLFSSHDFHFLKGVHNYIPKPGRRKGQISDLSPCERIVLPSALDLHNAGIRCKSYKGLLSKIRFEKATSALFLPTIRITDSTEVVIRNLTAFEMCETSRHIILDYAALMDNLIESHRDVALLRRAGIIEHFMGSDKEVADLINGLCKGFTFSSDAFHEVRSHVYQQYRSEWKVMIAQFAEEHCSRPWRTLSLLAAILLLAMAAVQTFYSIYK